MKHLLLLSAFALSLCGAAHANPVDIMTGRMAIQLQQAGLDPAQARWGAWAVLHNPHNDCARYASMISSQADMPSGMGYDGAHSTESDVIYVEQHNLCTEDNAKKGLGAEKRARDAQDKRDAKTLGIPEAWMKTGFTCDYSVTPRQCHQY